MDFEELIGTMMLWTDATTPENWMNCDGKILPIQSNQALYSLLGSNFGGDDRTNFALPKMPNVGNARYIICVSGRFPSAS